MFQHLLSKSALTEALNTMSFNQVVGFIWVYRSLGFGRETQLFDFFEDRMILLMEEELKLQKYLEKSPDVEDELGVGL